ncbi:MAG: glycosyltransferase family 39 protein, partial [Myxococcota bacterium]
MMNRVAAALARILPSVAALALAILLASVWWGRLHYPFDLEWMEGGMLAHAWRISHGLPLYVAPNPEFVPFVYPPGYSAVVAAIGAVVGLELPVGRGVSIAAIVAAAAAIGFAVRRSGGPWVVAAAAAMAFLGTYPQAGAFYDIVRPDALSVALAGWAVVLGAEPGRRAAIGAGLLLAAAFLVKQNEALLGLPIALGIALRSPRDAAAFVAASAGPALAAVGLLEWSSGGGFLTWMLAVPASHVLLWPRGYLDTPREWG